jgi:hypothetical protein
MSNEDGGTVFKQTISNLQYHGIQILTCGFFNPRGVLIHTLKSITKDSTLFQSGPYAWGCI